MKSEARLVEMSVRAAWFEQRIVTPMMGGGMLEVKCFK